jgi:hypothetical protein
MYPQFKFEFRHLNVQKNAKHTEKNDETTGMTILSGHIPLKNWSDVVLHPALGSHLKNVDMHNTAHKAIVAKVIGNGDMHNTAKYGVKNRKLLDGDHACKLI